MPDVRHLQYRFRSRSSRQACVLALVVSMTSAVVTGAVSSGDPSRAVSPRVAAARPAAPTVPVTDDVAAAGPADGASAAPPPTAPRGMSMDAPIQGGLTAHEEQALSARLVAAHRVAAPAAAAKYWTPAAGRSAVARAESWLGMPYSWAGGTSSAPTAGRCEPGTGGDLDCHVVGFDCSGLMMYAWGAYLALPHLASAQRTTAGSFHPTLAQLLPGDLVFFSGYLPGGTGHVAIYAGGGVVIEAPQSGSVVRRARLADLVAEDGTYRGAVRPMTAETPTLAAPRTPVPVAGGTVTLRGAHLDGVDAVHLGKATVRTFVRHTDSTIVVRVPAHAAGALALSVSTSWGAASKPVALTFAAPVKPAPAPTKPAPTKPAPTKPAPTKPAPTKPAPTPTKPAPSPTPTPTTPASSTGASSTGASSPPAPAAPAVG